MKPVLADRVLKTARDLLGIDVTYTPPGSPVTPVVVRGIFQVPAQTVELVLANDPLFIASTQPRLKVRLADLPGGDALVATTVGPIGGVTYTVAEVHRDGLGGALLVLAGP